MIEYQTLYPKDAIKIDQAGNYILLVQGDLKITYELAKESHIIIINQALQDILISEEGTIKEGGKLDLTYLDLSLGTLKLRSKIKVCQDAELKVVSKFLVAGEKDIHMYYQNTGPKSSVLIDNSAIVLSCGDLILECTGDIVKGAYQSSSHQKSRTLTFKDVKRALCIPKLLIDEDDVEASHAMSCGAIDEEIMFYMQSKGLDEKSAMRLLIHSYLMLDEMVDEELKSQLEKQVEEICLMY